MRIIYSRVYAKLRNHRFFSMEELNRALAEKTLEHNQTRMQRKNYSREEMFLAGEKGLLVPLPETAFEVKYYTQLRVGQNNHIYLGRDSRYYSVPYMYIGEKVQVIYTRTFVKIFCNNKQIAIHERTIGYGYTTDQQHLCSTHQHYNQCNPARYIEKAREKSDVLARLFTLIFNRPQSPELYYKTCDGLLGLCRKTEPAIFEKACQIALDNNVLSYRFVQSLIERNVLLTETETEARKPMPSSGKNIRGKQYYEQMEQ